MFRQGREYRLTIGLRSAAAVDREDDIRVVYHHAEREQRIALDDRTGLY